MSLAPRVAVTSGLRYTRDRKTIDNAGGVYTLDAPITLLSGSYAYHDAISHDAWTPKFGVEIRAPENLFGYVSATRGFKSGGFNLTSPESGRGFDPEWAWSYEGGLKAVVGGGRSRLNVAAFRTDYTDLQVQTGIRPGVIDISNAAAATITGIEVEAITRLAAGVQGRGHPAWLDAKYDRYIAIDLAGGTGDAAGHRLNNSPEFSWRAWIDWARSVTRAYSLSVRAEATWKSTVLFTPFNDDVQTQRPFGLVDFSAEAGPQHRRWSVTLYARNLANRDYITGSIGTPAPAIGGRPGDPRQVGVQFAVER